MHRARKIAELTKERLRRAAVIIQSQNPSHTGVEPLAAGIADWHDALAPAGETTVIFRYRAFAADVAKTNLAAILDQRRVGRVRSL